jgi:N-acetylglutamate synthase-like GNAT family acetyltransferase
MTVIEPVTSEHDSEELDRLLWETLWKPIGLPRNIRESFTVNGTAFSLVAKNEGAIVGGLVAVWTSVREVEIRHIAVVGGSQKRGVGAELANSLLETVAVRGCFRVHTIARNTSTGFFLKMGFTKASGTPPEHPDFKKHGILFELMERTTEPGGPANRRERAPASG